MLSSFTSAKVSCPYGRTWTPPDNWPSGDLPAYYMDFEALNYVELNNGAQHTIDGKVIFLSFSYHSSFFF